MKLPPEMRLIRLLSPGPSVAVALVEDGGGELRVVKRALLARAAEPLRREADVLRGLARAGVSGVPRLLAEEDDALVLSWLPWPTLAERGGVGPEVAQNAFDALEAVHAAGVVHGDVSPANVLVADDGSHVALIDFGLAQRVSVDDGAIADGAFRGTLAFAAPEVARGEPFDTRADRFALAASILQVATGAPLRPVGETASAASVLVNAGSLPFDASHPWNAAARALFPAPMAEGLLRCLAFDARDRPRFPARAW